MQNYTLRRLVRNKYTQHVLGFVASSRHSVTTFYENQLWPLIVNCNAVLGNYRDKVWLIGSPRSGTTWFPRLINWNNQYRELFEPFNYFRNEDAVQQYIRPHTNNLEFEDKLRQIFSGRYIDQRTEAGSADSPDINRRTKHRGLLVKDVTANLIAGWAQPKLPDVKIIHIIRNPFSVALSRLRVPEWFPRHRTLGFLTQPQLVEDYLAPHRDLIEIAAQNDFLREILAWAVENYVPLTQLTRNNVHIVMYEEAVVDPTRAANEVRRFLSAGQETEVDNDAIESTCGRPSRSTRNVDTIPGGKSPISAWRAELTKRQIYEAQRVLDRFGLAELYNGVDDLPDHNTIDNIRRSL